MKLYSSILKVGLFTTLMTSVFSTTFIPVLDEEPTQSITQPQSPHPLDVFLQQLIATEKEHASQRQQQQRLLKDKLASPVKHQHKRPKILPKQKTQNPTQKGA
jgi:hypothetical protein